MIATGLAQSTENIQSASTFNVFFYLVFTVKRVKTVEFRRIREFSGGNVELRQHDRAGAASSFCTAKLRAAQTHCTITS